MDNLELINQGYEGRDGICLSFSLSFSCFSFPFKHQLLSQVLREPFLVQTDMNPERWWRKKTLWVFPELRGFVFTLILRLLLTAPPLFCFYAYSMFWRLPRSTSHSFECKMTQFICLENITLCSNNCFDMIKEFSFINAPGSSFNGKWLNVVEQRCWNWPRITLVHISNKEQQKYLHSISLKQAGYNQPWCFIIISTSRCDEMIN